MTSPTHVEKSWPARRAELFCPRPFSWLEADWRGLAWPCCSSWVTTPIGDLKRQAISELWNSITARRVRASILAGTFHFCRQNRCPYLQKAKEGQKLEVLVERATVKDPRLCRIIDEPLVKLDDGPLELNCAYDLSCNLSCPSCRRGKILHPRGSDAAKLVSAIQDQVIVTLPRLEFLSVSGSGDPFGSPALNRLLSGIDAQKFPKLRIQLHTNGMLFTPKAWGRWRRAQPAIQSAEISIDAATAATYAKNRRGGDFAVLRKNLDFVAALRRGKALCVLKISFVVQANNFAEMPAFIALGKELEVDEVYFSRLFQWPAMDDDDFAARDVCAPEHPRHKDLRALLRDPIFADQIADLGNLSSLRADPP